MLTRLALALLLAPALFAQDEETYDLAAAQQARIDAGTLKVLGQPLRGHDSMLTGVQIHPDGRTCLSAGWDGVVKIWNLRQDGDPQVLSVDALIYFAAWCGADHDKVVASSGDGKLRLWSAKSGAELEVRSPDSQPTAGSVSPDGRVLALSYQDTDRIDLFAVGDTLEKLGELACGEATKSAFAWSPDGSHLAIGGILPSRLWIYDVATRELVDELEPDHLPVSLAVRADGAALGIGGYDYFELWSFPELGDEALDGISGFESTVASLHFANDEQILFGDNDGGVQRLHFAGDEPHLVWSVGEHRSSVVGISLIGDVVASASRDGTLRFWSADDGAEILRRRGSRDMVQAVSFSADGRTILAGDYGNNVATYDAGTGALRSSEIAHEFSVMVTGRLGDQLVSIAGDDTFVVLDAATGGAKSQGGLQGEDLPYLMCGTVHDGKLVGGWQDGSVRVHNLADGTLGTSFEVGDGALNGLAVRPDGSRVAVFDAAGRVTLWDAAGEEIAEIVDLGEDATAELTFLDDTTLVVAASDGHVRICDATDGEALLDITLADAEEDLPQCIAASAKAGVIALGFAAALVLIDAKTGELVASTGDYVAVPTAMEFSPDGRLLAMGMTDATTLLWDVASLRK